MRQSTIKSSHYSQHLQINKNNRSRLITQNKRIVIEIQKLDQVISTIIQKYATHDFEAIEEHQELRVKHKKQNQTQLREIARLKLEIKKAKANFSELKNEEVRNQENQIVFLRREYDKLLTQRHTLTQQKAQKQSALEYYKPLDSQTSQTYQKYKKIKTQNGQLKQKVHQLEREINKYHKIKELAKTAAPRQQDNPEFDFLKMQNEIKNMKNQMKQFDQKWKAKVQYLDKQYFGLKSVHADKELSVKEVQQQLKNLEIRLCAFRDQTSIASDRQRISSVSISPKKRKEMEDLIKQSVVRLKRIEAKPKDMQSKKTKDKREKDKVQAQSEPVLPLAEEKTEEKLGQPVLLEVSVDADAVKQLDQKEDIPVKPTKLMQSVGVGTSFYYDDS